MNTSKRLHRAASMLLILLLLSSVCGAAFAAAPEADLTASLDAYISGHESTTAGLALCVFDRENLLYENYVGFADMENRLPVTEETVFEWGSATKLLVWVSVMQLWEQGLIDLEADVRGYLPEGFLTNLRYEEPVRMLDLMNHRAGFQEMVTEIFLPGGEEIPSLEEALRRHEPQQVYSPDTVTAYSNWGVALAGYIVERVSGESFCDYVHEHIFAPLGMGHSALAPDLSDNEWVRQQRGKLQCYNTEGKLIPNCFYHIALYPAGMCTGTLTDFTSFARALLAEDCPLFTRAETRAELFRPTDSYEGTELARNCHGFWVEPFGVRTYGHGGNTAGCSSYLLLDPENGRGATVMTNQSGESIYNIDMMELIFGTRTDEPDRTVPKGVYRSARTVLTGPLKLYSAAYMIMTEDNLSDFWLPSGENAEKLSFPYGDLLKIPTPTLVLEWTLLLLWALAILFSLGFLLAWPLGALRRRRRKLEPVPDPRCGLRRWAAVLQMITPALIAVAVIELFRYAPVRCYAWCFGAGLCLGLAMLVLLALLLKKRGAGSKGARALDILTTVFLAGAVLNLLYWQVYAFWAL